MQAACQPLPVSILPTDFSYVCHHQYRKPLNLMIAHVFGVNNAAFTGLRIDIDRVRLDNNSKGDVNRKASTGLLIYDGREYRKMI